MNVFCLLSNKESKTQRSLIKSDLRAGTSKLLAMKNNTLNKTAIDEISVYKLID